MRPSYTEFLIMFFAIIFAVFGVFCVVVRFT